MYYIVSVQFPLKNTNVLSKQVPSPPFWPKMMPNFKISRILVYKRYYIIYIVIYIWGRADARDMPILLKGNNINIEQTWGRKIPLFGQKRPQISFFKQ